MKRMAIRCFIVAALAAAVLLVSCDAKATTIILTWKYDFVKDPACTPAIPTDCVKEFRIYSTLPSAPVLVVPVPTLTGTIELTGRYGIHEMTVTAVSDSGVESVSSNVVSVERKPGAPTGLANPKGTGPADASTNPSAGGTP